MFPRRAFQLATSSRIHNSLRSLRFILMRIFGLRIRGFLDLVSGNAEVGRQLQSKRHVSKAESSNKNAKRHPARKAPLYQYHGVRKIIVVFGHCRGAFDVSTFASIRLILRRAQFSP